DEPGVIEHALEDVAAPQSLRVEVARVEVGPALDVGDAPEHRRRARRGAGGEMDANGVTGLDGREGAEGRLGRQARHVVGLAREGKVPEMGQALEVLRVE